MAVHEQISDPPDSDDTVASGGGGETLPTPDGAASAPAGLGGAQRIETAGDQVGPYKLISKLGEGGFGTVWLAERRQPFVQQVALKIVKLGMDSKSVVARFEQERQALAVMNHPHVAKVLDGGLTPTGRPYFAMEYVKGEPITDYCDRQKLTLKQRLMLFVQVCEAVQHAHTKGIIHRDLKPGNILVASGDGDVGQAKVIDFGVAKALTQRMTEHTFFTETGQMIGTPSYMSPEQAEPDANDIDTRSDVYSLGVILYELLSGALPFDPQELRKKAYREIQRIIREEDPPSPSARLSTIATKDTDLANRIAQSRKDEATNLAKTLRSELEWIPLKAMRKERKERYDSPADLARDVQQYLEGLPLIAAPESTVYRIKKFVRRHRSLFLAGLLILGAVLIGAGLTMWQWLEVQAARSDALQSASRATSEKLAADAEREQAIDLRAVTSTSSALRHLQHGELQAAAQDLQAVRQAGKTGSFAFNLAQASLERSESGPIDLRGLDWPRSAVCSQDGHLLASTSNPNKGSCIQIWGLPSGELQRRIESPQGTAALAVSINRDGTIIAGSFTDGLVRRWSVQDGMEIGLAMHGHIGAALAVSFDPPGERLATGGEDGSVQIWDLKSIPPTRTDVLRGQGPMSRVTFSEDGRCVYASSPEGPVRVWDLAKPSPTPRDLSGSRPPFAVSADGSWIASKSADGTTCLWSAHDAKMVSRLAGGTALDMAFAPSDTVLAILQEGGDIQIWDAATQKRMTDDLRAFPFQATRLLFDSQGPCLLGIDRGQMHRWTIPALLQDERATRFSADAATALAFDPTGNRLATAGEDGVVRLWNPVLGRQIGLPIEAVAVRAIAFSGDGSRLVIGCRSGEISVLDARTRRTIAHRIGKVGESLQAIAVDTEGDSIGIAINSPTGGALELWHAANNTTATMERPVAGRSICSLAWSPDGRTLAGVDGSRSIYLWDRATAGIRTVVEAPAGEGLGWIGYGRNGAFLVTAGFAVGSKDPHGIVEVRSPDAATLLRSIDSDDWIDRAVIAPDDRTIATISKNRFGRSAASSRLRLWDLATGLEFGDGLDDCVRGSDLAFSPDGTMLAATSESGTRLFTARTYQARAAMRVGLVQRLEQAQGAADDLVTEIRKRAKGLFDIQSRLLTESSLNDSVREAALLRLASFAPESGDPPHAIRRIMQAAKDSEWRQALSLIDTASDATIALAPRDLLSLVAWEVLQATPTDSPSEWLGQAKSCAMRAVEASGHRDPVALQALALADWRLHERSAAIESQRKAVQVLDAAISSSPASEASSVERELVVHYLRSDRKYDGWNLWVWTLGEAGRGVELTAGERDSFAHLAVKPGVDTVGIILRKGEWQEKDSDRDRFVQIAPKGRTEIWALSGCPFLVNRDSLKEAQSTLAIFERDSKDQSPAPGAATPTEPSR